MHLTPRGLLLALAAILVSGVVFGVVTTVAPAITPSAGGTGSSGAAAAISFAPSELGDAEISIPSPTATPFAPSVVEPAPAPSVPVIDPTPRPTPTPSPPVSPGPVVDASPTAGTESPRAAAAARRSPPAAVRPPTASKRPTADAPRSTPVRAATPSRRPAVLGNWGPPALRVGVNALTPPQLSSGARVSVTVACSPRAACTISGDQLVIAPDAVGVTVRWSAPEQGAYRAWQVSRAM